MFVLQLSVDGGHFTSAEKVGDDTGRVKYLRAAARASGERVAKNLTFETISKACHCIADNCAWSRVVVERMRAV